MSLRFGDIRQLAFVVDDIDTAMAYWTGTLGVGPFFVMRQLRFDSYRFGGMPMPSPHLSIALAFSGTQQIELIEQHDDVPSVYITSDGTPATGFHHVSSWETVAEYDRRHAALLKDGLQIAQEGVLKSSGIRLSYWATQTQAHKVIFEMSDSGDPKHAGRIRRIQDAAQQWDGRTPVYEVRT